MQERMNESSPFALSALKEKTEEIAALLKLVSNANRLQILCCLYHKEANVTELERKVSLSQPALSQHLARMRQEGILETRREGQQIYYSICCGKIKRLLPFLDQLN